MKKNVLLECCVDSIESALLAEAGGADRLELCSGLAIGGLTPSVAVFRKIQKNCSLPIHVLIRPRSGDFLYTDWEFDAIQDEVSLFQHEGAQGVVIGCLTADGKLDQKRMETLCNKAGKLSVTLHRAFDMCKDPLEALESACQIGINTILTSGAKNSCMEGQALLKQLIAVASDRLEIMIGGGVNAAVIQSFLETTDASCFHMSGKEEIPSAMQFRNKEVSMGSFGFDEYSIWRTSEEAIRQAKQILCLKK